MPPACATGWRKEGSKLVFSRQCGMPVGSSSTTVSKVGSTAIDCMHCHMGSGGGGKAAAWPASCG